MRVTARLMHRLAHWFRWNVGCVETWWVTDCLWIGLRCECGALSGIHCRKRREGER